MNLAESVLQEIESKEGFNLHVRVCVCVWFFFQPLSLAAHTHCSGIFPLFTLSIVFGNKCVSAAIHLHLAVPMTVQSVVGGLTAGTWYSIISLVCACICAYVCTKRERAVVFDGDGIRTH